jgi:hypothetical protein
MVEFITDVRPSMALELDIQDGQKNQAPLTPDNLYALIKSGPTWAVKRNGRVIAIGGHSPLWEGRTVLWGYLSNGCTPVMAALTRKIKNEVKALAVDFPRIEAYAERHHKSGNRWLKMLGFTREGTMRKFANNRDYTLYARVT